jgi:hypothetical protein
VRNIILNIVKYFGRYLIVDLVLTNKNESNSMKLTYKKYYELIDPEYNVLNEIDVQSE